MGIRVEIWNQMSMSLLERDQIFVKTNSEKFAALFYTKSLFGRQKVGWVRDQLFPSPWFRFDRQASHWPPVNMLFFSLKGRGSQKILETK